MLDGMALALAQEALRVVQDAISLYQALRCFYAAEAPMGCVWEEGGGACGDGVGQTGKGCIGQLCMVGYSAVVGKVWLAVDVLE